MVVSVQKYIYGIYLKVEKFHPWMILLLKEKSLRNFSYEECRKK